MGIKEVMVTIQSGPNDITLYPGAEPSLINEFEKKIGFKLPAELKTFYQICNGFESADDLFRIIPLDEILERIESDRMGDGWKANQFYLAEYLIYCDVWTLEFDALLSDSYTIFSGDGSTLTALTRSFTEFLTRFLAGGVFGDEGLYKWAESISTGSVGGQPAE